MPKVKIEIIVDETHQDPALEYAAVVEASLTSVQELFSKSFNGLPADASSYQDIFVQAMKSVSFEVLPD